MTTIRGPILLLFPHQLFDISHIKRLSPLLFSRIYLVEHPLFYGERKAYPGMRFNKKKIVFHRATCLYYVDYLRKYLPHIQTIHIPHTESFLQTLKPHRGSSVVIFDPCDSELQKELETVCHQYTIDLQTIDSPYFLNTRKQLETYYRSKGRPKKVSHVAFYSYQQKLHDLPDSLKHTRDTENRLPIPTTVAQNIPPLPKVSTSKYIREASVWCNTHFPEHPGTTTGLVVPTTHRSAKQWLRSFLQTRFSYFGPYQDAMVPGEPVLFHSLLSPLLNIGLLTPQYVLDETLRYTTTHSIPVQSVEAFVRQIVGWREYQRFLYVYYEPVIRHRNIFGHTRKLSRAWYDGTTRIPALDDAIRQAWNTGYLHHIQRLMIVSNVMNLCMIHPDEVYRWFMEFSLDSYDWVMVGNVYSMGLWSDGGVSMRKPYISTGQYSETMSGKRWRSDETWRCLYYVFLETHTKVLAGTPHVRQLGYWKRLPETTRERMREMARVFIEKL